MHTTSSITDSAFYIWSRTTCMRAALMTQRPYTCFRSRRSSHHQTSSRKLFGNCVRSLPGSGLGASQAMLPIWAPRSARSTHSCYSRTIQSSRWSSFRRSACSTWTSTCWSTAFTWWKESQAPTISSWIEIEVWQIEAQASESIIVLF